MFSDKIKEHKRASQVRAKDQEERRKELVQSVQLLSSSYLEHVNRGSARVYQQQVKLEREAQLLQVQTARFVKQTHKWMDLYKYFDSALKVCGAVFYGVERGEKGREGD